MATDERETTPTRAKDAPQETTETTERLLNDQRLVNEREDKPQEFGGMPHSPVESREPPARPNVGEDTTGEEVKSSSGRRDIQTDGA